MAEAAAAARPLSLLPRGQRPRTTLADGRRRMEPVAVAPCSECRAPRCCPRHRNLPGPGNAAHAAVAELPQEGGDEPCPPHPASSRSLAALCSKAAVHGDGGFHRPCWAVRSITSMFTTEPVGAEPACRGESRPPPFLRPAAPGATGRGPARHPGQREAERQRQAEGRCVRGKPWGSQAVLLKTGQ